MTVLRDCILVSELEARLYKGAIRKCSHYKGKIVTSGGRSYVSWSDLKPEHVAAAEGLDRLDRCVPLHMLYEEVPGISKREAIRLIAESRREKIAGKIVRRRHAVYVRVDEETATWLETMTAFAIKGLEDAIMATKRTVIGNMQIGFY
jgi:hypothetical protein